MFLSKLKIAAMISSVVVVLRQRRHPTPAQLATKAKSLILLAGILTNFSTGFGMISLLTALAVGCGGSSSLPPIPVGHVATRSGPNKEAGEQAFRAIDLAVQEQAREAEKENLRPIVVRHTDTRGNLEAFEAEAVRLVTVNRVHALLGGTSAAEVAGLDRAGVPLVTPYGMPVRGLSPQVFFTGLSPAFQGKVLARFTAKTFPGTQVTALVDESREDALVLAEAFAQLLSKANAEDAKVPRLRTWRFGKENPIKDRARRLKEEKPQVVLLAGAARDLAGLRKELDPKVPILLGSDEGSLRVLQETGEANGVYLTTAFVPEVDVPRAREFVAAYRKAFHEDPDVHAALAYDGARLLFEALRRCKDNFSPDKLTRELEDLKDFAGLTGTMGFSPDHRLWRPAFLIQLEKGQAKTVKRYPAED